MDEEDKIPWYTKGSPKQANIAKSRALPCGLMARLLDKKDRRKLFEILLAQKKRDLKKTAKAMGIRYQSIYRYVDPPPKKKPTNPSEKTTANIIFELCYKKTDPKIKAKLKAMEKKIKKKVDRAFLVFHKKNIYDIFNVQVERFPSGLLGLIEPLLIILGYDEGLYDYPGTTFSPYLKRQKILKAFNFIQDSLEIIRKKYDLPARQTN